MSDASITLEQARAVVAAHREQETAAKAAEARKLIGRYFKYRNSYGGGVDERWWLYAMPTDVNEYGWVTALTFQHTTSGAIEIERRESVHVESGGWKEINAKEFWNAALAIRAEANVRLTPPPTSGATTREG